MVKIRDDERWHPVVNSPGFEVSSRGRIRVAGTREYKNPTLAKSGYLVVNLYQYRRSNVRNVHSLVAEAFISARPKGHMVVHLNQDRLDNRMENLRYCSLSQRRPLQANTELPSRLAPKLSEDQSSEIRRRAKSGESTSALAHEFGVSAPMISYIKHDRKWREINEKATLKNQSTKDGFYDTHSKLGCGEESELFWISDAQWERIKPLITSIPLPKRRTDDRRALSGIIHVLASSRGWGSCPTIYGSNKTLYKRWVAWKKLGLWERIFVALEGRSGMPDCLIFDYASVLAERATKTESGQK